MRRDKEAKGSARYAEQKAFHKQLAKDLPVGRTQSKAHGEFTHPACGPHQSRLGTLTDSHRHDKQHHTHHDEEWRLKLPAVGRETLCTRVFQIQM